MAIITSYPTETLLSDNDKFLTSNDAGATTLTPASLVNQYVGPGWTIAGESWTYSSYSGGVGVINVPTGATTRYSPGMVIKFTQPTLGVKYARINSVTSTTITASFAGGTVLSNEAITLPFYSVGFAPNGYPIDQRIKGSEIANYRIYTQADTTNVTQTAAVIQAGWGQILGTGAAGIVETVTFPTSFTTVLSVDVTFIGYKSGGTAATAITEFNTSVGGGNVAQAVNITASNFVMSMQSSGTFGAVYHGYSWVAIGI